VVHFGLYEIAGGVGKQTIKNKLGRFRYQRRRKKKKKNTNKKT
jgi:hypothetical protein